MATLFISLPAVFRLLLAVDRLFAHTRATNAELHARLVAPHDPTGPGGSWQGGPGR